MTNIFETKPESTARAADLVRRPVSLRTTHAVAMQRFRQHCVRPEDMRVELAAGQADGERSNTSEGAAEVAAFRGASIRCKLTTDAGPRSAA